MHTLSALFFIHNKHISHCIGHSDGQNECKEIKTQWCRHSKHLKLWLLKIQYITSLTLYT